MNHPYTIIDTAVVRVGSLIDGTGRPARKDLFVRVEKGMVQAITDTVPSGPHDLIDLSGCTVLPCLIDSHVHLFLSGSLDSEEHRRQMAAGFEDACRTIAENIDCQQSCGVLTVRDGGDGRAHVSRFLRDRVEKGHSLFLAQTPSRGWFKAGRYGKLVGGEPLPESAFLEAITGQMAAGADHVKLVNSGLNSLTRFGVQTTPQFTPDELAAIVALAHGAGRPVMVHANGEIPVRQAVEAGVDSIEHGYFMGTDNLLRMAERQTFWVPTLAPMHAFAQTTVDFSGVAARTLEHQMGQLAFARRVGVKVALGTDAGSPGVYHGTGVIRELELFMAAGYTMEEAVGCAAVCNADLLGLADRGRIAPDMPALWAVVSGDAGRLPASLAQAVVYAGKG
ncbi:amidohydrolase family protein [Desulfosudis oleivorans]|uniref:Amidohydrolase n=1 Tax=Desulfosudis oleivorans (strain DSM 6200 / JCM 39069 / Hxd3) TaxID=96561 RepID=A8ZZX5_DESOH|nr:amidohydrolase family protein [Desulfosudis oleivorans]ABW67375.1 amidohydrolase [Desulfosudis oleivorans Hxd3]